MPDSLKNQALVFSHLRISNIQDNPFEIGRPSLIEGFMNWLKTTVEILFLFLAFYALIRSFQGTLGERIIKGYIFVFIIVSAILLFITHYFSLHQLEYILARLMSMYLFIALVVIFQRELRIGLIHMGEVLFGKVSRDLPHDNKELASALSFLSRRKVGALIAIQTNMSLVNFLAQGIELDAKLSKELLWAIFWHESLLHDGGIIVQKGRVSAASCIFPLTDKPLPPYLGTRHRAAVGLSEVTDALVLVVSEQTGRISLCFRGVLYQNIPVDQLELKLEKIFVDEHIFDQFLPEGRDTAKADSKTAQNT